MSKFDDKLEEIIERKARILEEQFHDEFNRFINKWKLSDRVKWCGLNDLKTEKDKDVYKCIRNLMISIETEKFISEVNRLHSYFNNN